LGSDFREALAVSAPLPFATTAVMTSAPEA